MTFLYKSDRQKYTDKLRVTALLISKKHKIKSKSKQLSKKSDLNFKNILLKRAID